MKNYLINLDRRKDRLAKAIIEFNNQGMSFERVYAEEDKPGWVGCLMSHLKTIELGVLNNDIFGIYEDDVKFLYGPTMPIIKEAMAELPEDWDMLYLGCSPQEKFKKYSDKLYRMGKNHTTHAIIWHYRPNGALEWVLANPKNIKYDLLLSSYVHPEFNCFTIFPLLCTQHQTQSDCCKRSDLSTIQKNYNKYII